ncbi:MAG TPA: hypothetical protein VIY56_16175, partial [Vicinamibacterales bacterium]
MTRLGLLTLRFAVATGTLVAAGAALAQAPGVRPSAPSASVPARPAPRAATASKLAPRPGQVESDPIRCWWKTDRTSVRVGETF